jgi:hypothetical protein
VTPCHTHFISIREEKAKSSLSLPHTSSSWVKSSRILDVEFARELMAAEGAGGQSPLDSQKPSIWHKDKICAAEGRRLIRGGKPGRSQ